MSDYTKPPMNNLPFRFGTGGYSAPDFNDVGFKFKEKAIVSTYANVGATIVGVRDYLKYCPTYVVGYGPYGVQIIQGRCIYGGIRDLGAYINGVKAQGQDDLGATLNVISGYEVDLPAFIRGVVKRNLPASITGHLPVDLGGVIQALQYEDLGAIIEPIPGEDLNAYLKVYPQEDLPARIHGWEQRDLPASIYALQSYDLPATIGIHRPRNLTAYLKGWVREATYDLGASIRGYTYNGLGGIIRCTYLADLGAYLNPVIPVDLPASLYGWQEADLGGIINGTVLPWDLSASIIGTGGYADLKAYIRGMQGTKIPGNLGATISSWYTGNMGAHITSVFPGDLGAYLNVIGGSGDLSASIYPKMIRLTTVISFVTMEHSDMSATINICMGSESRNLTAYIRSLEKGDLGATIVGKWDKNDVGNLGASIGISNEYFTLDKLPIDVYVSYGNYWTEDKLPISLFTSRGLKSLSAYINGVLETSDMPAEINPVVPDPYGFENTKNRERVYFRNYMGEHLKFEVAEISFRSIVEDYFYVSGSGRAYKSNRLDRWITDVKSYIPRSARLNIKRRFHRMMTVHDITDFASVDEAIKFAIAYVTDYPEIDLGAYINVSGAYKAMGASITPVYTKSGTNNLTSDIVGTT